MGSLRLTALIATVCLSAALPARSGTTDPLLAQFAECAGRLNAQADYQRLTADPALPATLLRASAMADVLGAVSASDTRGEADRLAQQAKGAMSALLLHARYGTEARLSDRQTREAARLLATCEALLPQ